MIKLAEEGLRSRAILKISISSTSFEDLANEELLPIVSSKRKKENYNILFKH